MPPPPLYDDHRGARYRDEGHKKIMPRYESWSDHGNSGTVRKRCARDHTVRATPDIIVVGEKRGKRGEEEKKVRG